MKTFSRGQKKVIDLVFNISMILLVAVLSFFLFVAGTGEDYIVCGEEVSKIKKTDRLPINTQRL
jgi:hypothetical protein